MIQIYLSPSTQNKNIYYDKFHTEEQVMNMITDKIEQILSQFTVVVYRGHRDLPTTERVLIANQLEVDYYLTIHSNAGGGKGCEVFYQVGTNHEAHVNLKSKDYAAKLNRDFSSITLLNSNELDRGIKFKKFSDGRDYNHELRSLMIPANLIEVEFHDTKEGCQWILDNIDLIALKIAESIVSIFSLKRKEIIPEDDYFYVQTGAYKSLAEAELEAKKISNLSGQSVGIKFGDKNSLKWIKSVKK